MELVYVIKGFNNANEQKKWCVSESMFGEIGNGEVAEKKMLVMAEEMCDRLEREGWYITNKDIGMMWDDRRGYDPMGTFGKPLNAMIQVPKVNLYDKSMSRIYPDKA